MVDRTVVDEMLEALRFDEVVRLIEQTEDDPDPGLLDEVTKRRTAAEERARALQQRIVELGDEDRQLEVAEIAKDPVTRPLLDLLPDTSQRRAELHLKTAERWEARRLEVNARRLSEARRALDGLDLELASGLMKRIDGRHLTPELADDRDQLLLDISAREMEVETIAESGRQLIEKTQPRRDRDRRPWWKRWFG